MWYFFCDIKWKQHISTLTSVMVNWRHYIKIKQTHTCDTEVNVVKSFSSICVLDNALIGPDMWDVQVIHVHCCAAVIHSGVLPPHVVGYRFCCKVPIDECVTSLKVEKGDTLVFDRGALNGHIHTNLPSDFNLCDSSWKRKVRGVKR